MRIALLLAIILISGCAIKTWKVEEPSEVYNSLIIRVKTDYWNYYPSDLNRYVIPIYIEVENRGKEAVRLTKEEVFLIDEKGNQYNPLEPRDVISMVERDYSMGVGLWFGYWSSPFGIWWSPYYTFPRSGPYPDIVNNAFSFGEVQSGARLKGFVYFPKVLQETNLLTLYVKGYKFKLKKS